MIRVLVVYTVLILWNISSTTAEQVPTSAPTGTPTGGPTGMPSGEPTNVPTGEPTSAPSIPTGEPTSAPSMPTGQPTSSPTSKKSSNGNGSDVVEKDGLDKLLESVGLIGIGNGGKVGIFFGIFLIILFTYKGISLVLCPKKKVEHSLSADGIVPGANGHVAPSPEKDDEIDNGALFRQDTVAKLSLRSGEGTKQRERASKLKSADISSSELL